MASPRYESDEVTLRARNPIEAAIAIAIGVLGPLAALAVAIAANTRALLLLAPIAMIAGALRWRANKRAREQLGRLTIGPLGIFFDGRRLASSAGVSSAGIVTRDGDAPIVRLATRSGLFE